MRRIRDLRLWIVVAFVAALLGCLFVEKDAHAEDLTYGDFTYSVSNGKVTITKYKGSEADVTVPDTIDGMPVTRIAQGTFSNKYSIVSVKLPDSLLEIDYSTFDYCKNLIHISIPSGVTRIESFTFYHCESLRSIELPAGLRELGYSSFESCKSLTCLELPTTLEQLGTHAFLGCSSLTTIDIPSGVKYINSDTFFGCSGLVRVGIPDSILQIEEDAFSGCTSLFQVYYGGSEVDWKNIHGISQVPDSALKVYNSRIPVSSGHKWDTGTVTTEATCTKKGEKTFKCTKCGLTRTETIKAAGHKIVTDKAVAPTVSKTGLTAGSHCSVCNAVIKKQEVIPKLHKNGWMKTGGKWYYYSNNVLKKGWLKDGNKWYYLDSKTGAMVTGWRQVGSKWYFLDSSGVMKTGWVKDGSKWYYLDPKTGAMKTGWLQSGKAWYFLDKTTGAMKTGWVKDGGKWYFLNASGTLYTGWKKLNGNWYYFNPTGEMHVGWKQLSGKWYYFDSDGVMATRRTWINGKAYIFNSNGEYQEPMSASRKKELTKFLGYFAAGFWEYSWFGRTIDYDSGQDPHETLKNLIDMRAFNAGIFPVDGVVMQNPCNDPKGRFQGMACKLDATKVDWILKNQFYLSDASLKELKSDNGSGPYYSGGYYYGYLWDGGGGGSAELVSELGSDEIYFNFVTWGSEGKESPESGVYAFVKYKYYNGKGYWSIDGVWAGD